MANIFELVVSDDYVYENFVPEYVEQTYGKRLNDDEIRALCAFIVNEMCAKPIGTSHQVGINTRFGEWFADSMPNTFGLMLDLMHDGLGCFIEQKIDEKYGKEGE